MALRNDLSINVLCLISQDTLPEVVFQVGNKWAFNLATTLQLQLQLKVKRLNGNGQTQKLKK